MQNQPREVIVLFFGTIAFWLLLVGAILVWGGRWERIRPLGERMRGQWLPALIITIAYLVSVFLSGRGFNPYGIAIFCQALIGLAIARGIPSLEPVPVIDSVLRREPWIRKLSIWIVAGLIAGLLGMVFGGLAMGFTQSFVHEINLTDEILQEFPASKFQAFFMFLAGGGIAEEMVHRLVLLSLVWALTGRPWFAIVVAAIVHSGYHFTPANLLHQTFLQFPISQFVSGVVMGSWWGYVFVKRGYETAALGHTLSDWLAVLFFR